MTRGTTIESRRRVNHQRLWVLLSAIWLLGAGAWGVVELAPEYERFASEQATAAYHRRIEEQTGKSYKQWYEERLAFCRESVAKTPAPAPGGIFMERQAALFDGCMRPLLRLSPTGFAAFRAEARLMGDFIIAQAPVWGVLLLIVAAVPLLGWRLLTRAIPTTARAAGRLVDRRMIGAARDGFGANSFVAANTRAAMDRPLVSRKDTPRQGRGNR